MSDYPLALPLSYSTRSVLTKSYFHEVTMPCLRSSHVWRVRSSPRDHVPSSMFQVYRMCHIFSLERLVNFIQDCGNVVANKFFPIHDRSGQQAPLCERDYFRRLNLICSKCGGALRGSYIAACSTPHALLRFLDHLTSCREEISRRTLHMLHMSDIVQPPRLVL